ncbi:hypothetical protein [Cupriavidus metallidurans]|uniref:Uncharacterized protein n=1 Tax=Cupriavidus metallidurans TaxID=119219 RepID=A0A482IQG1_9BURK|nr:hypothetical protein [Cupriavidus metallidurans]QBP09833.1 hypothetical protein DDF84_008700 [Cupriavidus metallidurans]
MDDTQRIQQLEGQVNALAHAWLTLVAALETQEGFDAAGLQASLRKRRWPQNPALNAEARPTLSWLCDCLDEARTTRQSGGR